MFRLTPEYAESQARETHRAQASADVTLAEMFASLESVSSFGDGWETMTQEQRRERIVTVVEAVIVTDDRVDVLLKVDNKRLLSGGGGIGGKCLACIPDIDTNDKHLAHDFYALNVPITRRRRSM